mmetsp:Transcript_97571/g.173777  ORF Transcript_97571/g.173777 Transcript_97571/m.173777 type:complete len:136 (-) Transcript_97571:7-414(-)
MAAKGPEGSRPTGRDGRHRPMRARRYSNCPNALVLAAGLSSGGQRGAVVLQVGEVDLALSAALQRALVSLPGVLSATSEAAHFIVNCKTQLLAADPSFHGELSDAAEALGLQAAVVAFRGSSEPSEERSTCDPLQ